MKKKIYRNWKTGQNTDKASVALHWHNKGIDVSTLATKTAPGVLIHGAHVETDREKTDRENRETCRRIAEDLEYYYFGNVYRCPDCGEIITLPGDVGDKYCCPNCKTVSDIDDLEQLGVYDYFDDVFDIEYRVGSDRELRSVQIMVACGGPNIYIDTASRNVELYWWGDRASYPISRDVCGDIDSIFDDIYKC